MASRPSRFALRRKCGGPPLGITTRSLELRLGLGWSIVHSYHRRPAACHLHHFSVPITTSSKMSRHCVRRLQGSVRFSVDSAVALQADVPEPVHSWKGKEPLRNANELRSTVKVRVVEHLS